MGSGSGTSRQPYLSLFRRTSIDTASNFQNPYLAVDGSGNISFVLGSQTVSGLDQIISS
jgi:hypothetical protein